MTPFPSPGTATPAVVRGACALELAHGTRPARAALPQAEAGALAALLARDLAALVPEAAALELVVAAAHFDPAEMLRPGWPLHQRLAELQARAPKSPEPRVIAFGADADGTVPMPLQADPELEGGMLRVLPWLLVGPADVVARVGAALEQELIERGMAGADAALMMQERLGATIEHTRHLTVHDLAAMTALQYEHVGLAPLWPLLETALLAPGTDAWLDAPPEPVLWLRGDEVRMAMFDEAAWRAHYAAGIDDPARLARGYQYFVMRQKQLEAVLGVHGLVVVQVPCPVGADPRVALAA